jgi:hypothetical protein
MQLKDISSNSAGVTAYKGYTIRRIDEHVVEIKFENGFEGELEDAKLIVQRIGEFCINKAPVFLLAIYAEDNIFSKEARNYVASKEVNTVVKAEALVINGMALRIMGNFYLKVNKPARPSKLFNDRELALAWLNKQI